MSSHVWSTGEKRSTGIVHKAAQAAALLQQQQLRCVDFERDVREGTMRIVMRPGAPASTK
jgi:hypothetical protein